MDAQALEGCSSFSTCCTWPWRSPTCVHRVLRCPRTPTHTHPSGILGHYVLCHRVRTPSALLVNADPPSARFSSIIVSRFLLNLRQVGAAESGAGADSGIGSRPSFVASHPSRLVFASVVLGNLGEQLDLPYGEPLSGSEDLDLDMDFSDTCGGSAEHGTILESGIGR